MSQYFFFVQISFDSQNLKKNKMKKNMSNLDRIIRLVIIAVIAILYYTGTVQGVFAFILLGVAGILLLTSFVNFCPLYRLLGINTCRIKTPN